MFMLISGHWNNRIGRSEQQPRETIQCERIGAPDANVSYAPIPALCESQLSVSVQDTNIVGAPDTKNLAMSYPST
jgi:hypothetical protein